MANQGNKTAIQKPLNRGMWWACFLLASFVMSLCFQTFKAFTLVPNWSNGLVWAVAMLLMAQMVLILIYDSYVQETANGRIQRPIRLFEWMMQKRFLLRAVLEQKEEIK